MQKKEQIDHEISSNYNPKRQSRKYLGKNNPKNHESVFLAFVFVSYVSQDQVGKLKFPVLRNLAHKFYA